MNVIFVCFWEATAKCSYMRTLFILKWQQTTSLRAVSKWCYCIVCKDNWISPTVTSNNNTGQNVKLFNHLVCNRNRSPVNPPFPSRPHARWQTKLCSDSWVYMGTSVNTDVVIVLYPLHCSTHIYFLMICWSRKLSIASLNSETTATTHNCREHHVVLREKHQEKRSIFTSLVSEYRYR